jgi:prepilin-type N-terminal cleavage/methylation domain-containing protein
MAALAATTILPIGMEKSDDAMRSPAFTLVELLLVMAILLVVMGVVAPSLSRSLRARKVSDEASRFLALTEFARDSAVSEGMPMMIWVNGSSQHYGLDPMNDYLQSKVHREYALTSDVQFDPASAPAVGANTSVIQYMPNGTPAVTSVAGVKLVDHFGGTVVISLRSDGSRYEIQKNTP